MGTRDKTGRHLRVGDLIQFDQEFMPNLILKASFQKDLGWIGEKLPPSPPTPQRIGELGHRFTIVASNPPKKKCKSCGKDIHRHGRNKTGFCRNCLSGKIREETDKVVFSAIVKFMIENNGVTPTDAQIAERSNFAEDTIRFVLRRLIATGKLSVAVSNKYRRSFIIPGGRWIYEGEL